MRPAVGRTLFWTPRILTILFILFLAFFALDVFSEEHTFRESLTGFLIHLIPNFVLAGILLLAWKWEWIGAVGFTGAGIFYLVMMWGDVHPGSFFIISGPAFLIGLLFLVGWRYRKQVRNQLP